MLAIMLARSVFAGHFEQHDHFGFEAAAWYWHFVDVIWLFLFAAIYILSLIHISEPTILLSIW